MEEVNSILFLTMKNLLEMDVCALFIVASPCKDTVSQASGERATQPISSSCFALISLVCSVFRSECKGRNM